MEKKHHFLKGFFYAGRGIAHGVTTEFNLAGQIIVGILVIIAGIFFQISRLDWVAVILCLTIVSGLELVNSAIEDICDHLRDDLGLAYAATQWPRDLAAGAVLWATIGSFVVGLLVFWQPVVEFLTN